MTVPPLSLLGHQAKAESLRERKLPRGFQGAHHMRAARGGAELWSQPGWSPWLCRPIDSDQMMFRSSHPRVSPQDQMMLNSGIVTLEHLEPDLHAWLSLLP